MYNMFDKVLKYPPSCQFRARALQIAWKLPQARELLAELLVLCLSLLGVSRFTAFFWVFCSLFGLSANLFRRLLVALSKKHCVGSVYPPVVGSGCRGYGSGSSIFADRAAAIPHNDKRGAGRVPKSGLPPQTHPRRLPKGKPLGAFSFWDEGFGSKDLSFATRGSEESCGQCA